MKYRGGRPLFVVTLEPSRALTTMSDMNATSTNTQNIREACEEFLAGWDRQEWMDAHGTYASEEWTAQREAYEDARKEVEDALESVDTDGDSASVPNVQTLLDAVHELMKSAKALDGQVVPDEDDYIAEGLIDPDGVSDEAEDLDVGASAQGWDCYEGWTAHRKGAALLINWYRSAWGNRRGRDLWVLVDPEFFHEDGE